jgi:hypothetical protein
VRFLRGPFDALLASMALSCFAVAIGLLRLSERSRHSNIFGAASRAELRQDEDRIVQSLDGCYEKIERGGTRPCLVSHFMAIAVAFPGPFWRSDVPHMLAETRLSGS